MGFISAICRVYVIFVNILFLILGLILFGGGLFLRFGDKIINNVVSTVETLVEKAIKDVFTKDVDIDLDTATLFMSFALGFIFAGLILIAITISGCCGSCYKIKFLLIIYVVICVILLAGEAVIVGLVYKKPDVLHTPVKTALKDSIQSDYAGLEGTDVVSIGWNVVMQLLDCCGVDNYQDFTGASNWNTTVTFKSAFYTLKAPLSCCKNLPTSSSTDLDCAENPTVADSNYLQGCFQTVWDLFREYDATVGGVLGGIGAFQLLLIVAAIVILCSEMNDDKNKVEPESPPARKPQRQRY